MPLDVSITLGDSSFHAQGDADVVMQALGEFKALLEGTPKPKRQASADGKHEDKGGETLGADQPLAVFVKRTWPGQAEKATAIVMWARHSDSKPSLKPSEIEDYWRGTTGKVPANMPQVCKTAVTHGWLHSEGGGKYSVTGHGEEMVNNTAKG